MAQLPTGTQVPDENKKKARVFFDRGRTVEGTGNYDYAIEMYVQGLTLDPDSADAHQSLRDISLKRKATGGKALGFLQAMGIKKPTKDDKQNLVNAAKLLAFDPGNTEYMVSMLQNAQKAGYYNVVMWVGPILLRANADTPKPEFNKFIVLRDAYENLKQFKEATEACNYALRMKPDDMELQRQLKNLGAMQTMANRDEDDFTRNVKNFDEQKRLMEGDADIRSAEASQRVIRDAEQELAANPDDPGKVSKLVDALVKTENPDFENRAIELLEQMHKKTKAFRWRHRIGQINLAQMSRMERSLRQAREAHPEDPELQKDYEQFVKEKIEGELKEYTIWAENYPTDMSHKFHMADRMFRLKRYDDAIPVFQNARMDPKYKFDAAVYLGRSFLESGFTDEAVDTFRVAIEEYPVKGDNRSREMFYWYGRTLEEMKDLPAAIKAYSQVFMWDATYRDVHPRMKKLRGR